MWPKDKKTTPQSPNTMRREKPPTNKHTSQFVPAMAFDFSKQDRIVPAQFGGTHESTPYRAMNDTGKPYALGNIEVGGGPDIPAKSMRSKQRDPGI